MINEVHAIIKAADHKAFYGMGLYTQFTIDFLQDAEDAIQDQIDNEEELSQSHIDSIIYQIDCILDIAKEGEDKKLFEDVKSKLEELS